MKTLLVIFYFLIAESVNATESIFEKEITLPAMQFLSSGMPNTAPSIYIWDEKGIPAYYYTVKDIRAISTDRITYKQDTLNSQNQKGFVFLQNYLAEEDFFKQGKKVLLLHVIDSNLSPCPPCDEAENKLTSLFTNDKQGYLLLKTVMVN